MSETPPIENPRSLFNIIACIVFGINSLFAWVAVVLTVFGLLQNLEGGGGFGLQVGLAVWSTLTTIGLWRKKVWGWVLFLLYGLILVVPKMCQIQWRSYVENHEIDLWAAYI